MSDQSSGMAVAMLLVLVFVIVAIAGGLSYWGITHNKAFDHCDLSRRNHHHCTPKDCSDRKYCPHNSKLRQSSSCQRCDCNWTLADNCDPSTGDCMCGGSDACENFNFCNEGSCAPCDCDETISDGCTNTAENCTCGKSAACLINQECVEGICQSISDPPTIGTKTIKNTKQF